MALAERRGGALLVGEAADVGERRGDVDAGHRLRLAAVDVGRGAVVVDPLGDAPGQQAAGDARGTQPSPATGLVASYAARLASWPAAKNDGADLLDRDPQVVANMIGSGRCQR